MKYRYLRAFIVLLAGLITLIINMKIGKNVTTSLLIVLLVIIIFYFVATLLVEILQHNLEKWDPPKIETGSEEAEEEEISNEEEEEVSLFEEE